MKTPLSKVYLDDYPIELMGDEARPPLSRIVRAAGKIPARVDIIWLDARSDPKGAAVDPDEFIDRTSDPTRPIYLRSVPRSVPAPRPVTAPATGDPAIAQLGSLASKGDIAAVKVVPVLTRKQRREEQQASAEAAAEERQEEQRNEEDVLADELEAREEEEADGRPSP